MEKNKKEKTKKKGGARSKFAYTGKRAGGAKLLLVWLIVFMLIITC